MCIRLVLKLKIEKLHTWGHAQNDKKLLKLPKIGVYTISINFGVPLWPKFSMKSFETLQAYQTIYKLPLCKSLRWFNIVRARNGRSKFARARGENFAHSWFRINSAFPRNVNDIVYYMILMPTWMSKCSCHLSKCLLKHKEMFSTVTF